MTKGYVIGLGANEEPCPVCDVKPQMFRQTATEDIVECGRCGLPSGVDLTVAPRDRRPTPGANAAWLGIFRRYWQETGQKITAPSLVGPDVELAGRMRALNGWLRAHENLVAHANAATAAPYTSLTAVCVELERSGEVRKVWSLFLPNEVAGAALALPFDAEGFVTGTIVTIQTPIPIPGKRRPEPPT